MLTLKCLIINLCFLKFILCGFKLLTTINTGGYLIRSVTSDKNFATFVYRENNITDIYTISKYDLNTNTTIKLIENITHILGLVKEIYNYNNLTANLYMLFHKIKISIY